MVSEAQLVHDVERGKHRGSEVIELLRSSPTVSIRKQGEDNGKRIVALLFEGQKKSLDALLRCRYHILIADNAETVRRKDKVELWHCVQHRLCSCDDTAVMQERCAVRVRADATHRVGRNESGGKPLLRL